MRQLGALTERQHAVLVVIVRFHEATGEIPSLSYLARRLGLDRTTVRDHVEALHRKGWLRAPVPGPPAPHIEKT
jgi:DNA-binding MarR family transcriptional regulator